MMSGGTATDAATTPKLGDRVLVPGIVVEHNGLLRVEVVPTDTEDALPIDHDPEPYTEPRDGDEVEATVRGKVGTTSHGVPRLFDGSGMTLLAAGDFKYALAAGRVRLVKAAAPTYEPGLYLSASTGRWVLYPDDGTGQPWLHLDVKRHSRESMWHTEKTIPADLVPCDVVPREAT